MATAKRARGTMRRSSSTRCVALSVVSRSGATAHGGICAGGPWGVTAAAHGGGGGCCGSTVDSVQA